MLPPIEQEVASVEFEPGVEPFGFYMKGHSHVSFTASARPSKAKIAHAARVFPVRAFQEETMRNIWAIGFEEATNGDYQDAVRMLENVVLIADK